MFLADTLRLASFSPFSPCGASLRLPWGLSLGRRGQCVGEALFSVCAVSLLFRGPANEGTTFSPCRQSSVPVAGNGDRMVAFSRKTRRIGITAAARGCFCKCFMQ